MDDICKECISNEQYDLLMSEISVIKDTLSRLEEKLNHDRSYIYKDDYSEIYY